MDKLLSSATGKRLTDFFEGPIYPIAVCLLIFVGHTTATEYYLNFINMALITLALIFSTTLRPLFAVVCTYLYQFSVENSPSVPAQSDYFMRDGRPIVMTVMYVIVFGALIFFFIRNRIFSNGELMRLPLILPSALLTVAFLLNGVLGGEWCLASFGYGMMNVLAFFIAFYLFYLGFKRDDPVKLAGYFAYVSSLIALIIIGEVAVLYLTSGELIVDGSVNKEAVLLGWGNWNNIGQNLLVTLPAVFYGIMRGRMPWYYFTVAVLTVGAAALTMSRNALIFGVLTFAACAIIACFFGKVKKQFRVIVPIGVVGILGVAAVFHEKIFSLLKDYIDRGASDNGRFELYRQGIEEFLSAPIFGKGFFGIHTDTFNFVDFFPQMMHSTPIQLLASMGIFGLAAYLVYRAFTVVTVIRRPSLEKTMLSLCMLVLILQSLLDNFIFYIQPVLHYSIALAVICRLNNADVKKTL